MLSATVGEKVTPRSPMASAAVGIALRTTSATDVAAR